MEFPIVGIGSSAGGLDALQKLFRGMPADSGMAFVLAAHLDPTQESHLAHLLGRCTEMPVVEVRETTPVAPDHVYVIAPDRQLAIRGGKLETETPTAPRGHRHPVDNFFRSLAEDAGERAIAVVLSGTGTNGSQGLRFVKAEGGIAIAQDPDTAGFAGMPRSAIGTGVVDLVLAPEEIPDALVRIASHTYVREPEKAVAEAAPEDKLGDLLTLIRRETNQDFSSYKQTTLLRRILRRMGLHQIEGLDDYVRKLRDDPDELTALVADLTINVTGFFRDPEAWRELDEQVIGPLVRERASGETVRVWVPGCSTGEEAYSVAMLVTERAEEVGKSLDLRIFATDVAQGVLSTARSGAYPGSIEADMQPDRLERFFEREDDICRVRKSLRDAITFAPQNLIHDPPFSGMDLVSCRNLLMYLKPEMQRKVLRLFHFALREGGHLFLGSAETVGNESDLFETVSKKARIYRRVGPTRHDIVDFPLVGAADTQGGKYAPPAPLPPRFDPRETMERALLDRHAPASALVDRQHRVRYLRGPTQDYLQPAVGEPSSNLFSMARRGLQMPLRTTLRRALEEKREVSVDARVDRGGKLYPVRIVVSPIRSAREEPALLVCFFEREAEAAQKSRTEQAAADQLESDQATAEDRREAELEAELDATRDDLHRTVAQMEDSNEELRSSNEEVRSMNEELQASNEELETSKEELQSLNEELNTVNNQLRAKVEELEALTDDLNNLLLSTDVATLFLDRDMRVRWFTPTLKSLFELRQADIGRPLSHFAPRFTDGDLIETARGVLRSLTPVDSEVRSDDGRWYIRRIVPYRTGHDQIDGVVVTFTEITDRKKAERAQAEELRSIKVLHELGQRALQAGDLEGLLQDVLDALIELHGADFGNLQLYDPGSRTLRIAAQRGFDKRFLDHFAAVDADEGSVCGIALRKGKRIIVEDTETDPSFEESRVEARHAGYRAVQSTPLFDERGRPLGMISTHFRAPRRFSELELRYTDIAVRMAVDAISSRRLQDALRQSEERLRRVLETEAIGVLFFDKESGTLIDANDAFLKMTGYTRHDVESGRLSWRSMTPDEWVDVSEAQMARLAETGRLGPYEKEYILKDGGRRWMLFVGRDLGDGTAVEYVIDITERKQAETERELLSRELSHRVKNTLAVVQSLAKMTNGGIETIEEYREAFLGRLDALARSHSLLLEDHWRSTDLRTLVDFTVSAFRIDHPEMIVIEGDSVMLTAKQAMGMGLVLHELGTNAVKHGALSVESGQLRIAWWIEEASEPVVHLTWRERDGPPVAPPEKRGFGMEMIEQTCSYELDGEARLEFAPEGVSCEMTFPLGEPKA